MKYAFIDDHRIEFSVRSQCRMLRVHFSGFYAWLKTPLSTRAKEDARQTDLIDQAWKNSGKVYGYRRLHDDLCDQGEVCPPNRVARLASLAGIKAQIGYKRRPGHYGGKPSIVGWSMQSRMTVDLALQALLMAVWRRKPTAKVTIHSDQGSQFSSREWQSFLRQHNLEASMSRRGNCHDNAVAESFFQRLRRERIRRKTYASREAARQDVFEYIEMFYNPQRKHTNNGMLSPVEFERQQKLKMQGV